MENCHFWNAFWAAQTNFVTPKKTGVNKFANGHLYHKLEDLLEPIHDVLAEQGIRFYFEDINDQLEAGVTQGDWNLPTPPASWGSGSTTELLAELVSRQEVRSGSVLP